MRKSWDEKTALTLLKKWIIEGSWRGTTHFRRHNSSLYEYLYRTMGLDTAFEKIGFHYEDYKKSTGKKRKERDAEDAIHELQKLIEKGNWQGIRHLQRTNNSLYRDLSRIGFPKAFHQLGFDYKQFRYAIWDQEKVLNELKEVIDSGEWKGALHLKETNSRLYNATNRYIGFREAFQAIGLNYDDFQQHDTPPAQTEDREPHMQ